MADADPKEAQNTTEAMNMKLMGDMAMEYHRSLQEVAKRSIENFSAMMAQMNTMMAHNADFATKLLYLRLELDPKEAAAAAALLQQAIKAAQSTQPETGGKPPTG